MTRQHIAALYFEGSKEAAKKRIQKLLAAKLIVERPRARSESAILYLTKRGYEVLRAEGQLADYPNDGWTSFQKRIQISKATIQHELDVMSIKATMVAAVRQAQGITIAEFSTWPKLYEFRAFRSMARDHWGGSRNALMKPDGHLRIHVEDADGRSEYACFLEVDRSSETLQTVVSKIEGYRDYYKSGGYAERMGHDRANPAECPFRVLMVCRSAERRNNIAARLLQLVPPVKTLVWLSTMAEVLAAPLGPIWIRPADYEKAVPGADFDHYNQRSTEPYRRDSARDAAIEQTIEKHALLDD